MAEPTLSLKRDDVRTRIALYLGYGVDPNEWEHDQITLIDLCLADGLRKFESPVIEKQPYEWSFRKVQGTLTTVVAQQAYDITQDDFTGILDVMINTAAGGGTPIAMIPVDTLLQKASKEAPANGVPQYAALRKKAGAPSTTQSVRWEVLLFPKPSAIHTIQYTYPFYPDSVSTNTFLSVPAPHSQTVIAAALSVAEQYTRPEETTQRESYQELLAASAAHDQQVGRSMEQTFAYAAPAFGTYSWFARRIGNWLQHGWNQHEWSAAQTEEVDDILQRGLKKFYFPTLGGEPHTWSFLTVSSTIAMVTNQVDYPLPSGFQGILGSLTFKAGSTDKPVTQIPHEELRALRASSDTAGTPQFFAVTPKTTTGSSSQLRQVSLYPKPDSPHNTDDLSFRYTLTPGVLTTTNSYPYGGEAHSECILAACRSVWAQGTENQPGSDESFQMCLAASVAIDRQNEISSRNTTVNVTSPQFGTYLWFTRQVGDWLGFGWNQNEWTESETTRADDVLQRGLNKFYFPMTDHSWSFLTLSDDITMTTNTVDYPLPAGFQGLLGDLTFPANSTFKPVTEVPHDELRSMRASSDTAGTPQFFAITPKTTTGSASQLRQVSLYPKPSSTHNSTDLSFRYTLTPAVLDTSNPHPYGGTAHAETILAACRSVVASGTEAQEMADAAFDKCLAASVQIDRQQEEREKGTSVNVTAPSFGTYLWFTRKIGEWLGFGWNQSEWTESETTRADDILQRGLKCFYFPPPLPVNTDKAAFKPPHRWSFLSLTGTFTMVVGQATYPLPEGFQGVDGDLSYPAGDQNRSIKQITDSDRRGMSSDSNANAVSKYFSVLPQTTTGAANQLRQIVLYPPPSGTQTLTYRSTLTPGVLTSTNPHPYGGTAHAETILAACRYVWAQGTEQEGPAYQSFTQRLSASVETDKSIEGMAVKPWSPTASTYGTYDWLLEEVGDIMGIGANPTTWTHEEERRIDSFVQRGYELFLQPHLASNPRTRHHRWSFLYATETLTTSASYTSGAVTVSSGTVTLAEYTTGTVGASSGTVTLAGGTWPTWAGVAELTISGITYPVSSRTSDTVLELESSAVTFGGGATYSLGGTFPAWAADGDLVIDGSSYEVATRTSGTEVVLVDTSVSVAAETVYSLDRVWYDLPVTMQEIDGPLTYQSGSVTYPNVLERDERYIRMRRQSYPNKGTAQFFALAPKIDTSAGTSWRLTSWPLFDGEYVLTYRYKVKPGVLSTNKYPLGGSQHAETVLASCLALIDPNVYRDEFAMKLESSVAMDQREQSPTSLGVGRDATARYGDWDDWYRRDNHTVTYS